MLVSVVIPTYKRTTYLRVALESVLRQTYGHFECLVVNDYPPFAAEVAQVIAELNDDRICLINNPQNGGESFSRNNAIARATGDLIALLDDDDYWEPEFLERHVAAHTARPEIGLAYCGYVKFWDDQLLGNQVFRADAAPPENEFQAMVSGRFVMASSSIISVKKACFEACGVFDTSLPSFADWDMWVRISQQFHFANIPEPLTWYRHHLGERGSTDIDKRMTGIEVISQKWRATEGFGSYERKLRVRAYFNEIRNEVLRGNRVSAMKLLGACLSRCRSDIPANYKPFVKAILIVVFGKMYMAGHRFKYS